MLATLPGSGDTFAPWLLARRGFGIAQLRARLQALQPLSRSALIERWTSNRDSLELVILYYKLFGEYPDGYDPRRWNMWDVSFDLAGRVHQELFPLDLHAMDDYANCGENPVLNSPIMIEGLGVPWEICPIGDFSDAARPLVAVYALSGNDHKLIPYDYPAEDLLEAIADWWDQLPFHQLEPGGPEFAWPQDPDGVRAMLTRLECLDPPLDGLAPMLRCVIKESGNLFLDTPDTYAFEYLDFFWEWFWCEEDIRRLAELWDQVKEQVEKMEAYIDWIKRDPTNSRVLQTTNTLIRLGNQVDEELEHRRPRTLIELFLEPEEGQP